MRKLNAKLFIFTALFVFAAAALFPMPSMADDAKYWTGEGEDNKWNTEANWGTDESVPGETDEVIINNISRSSPEIGEISDGGAKAFNLTIGNSGGAGRLTIITGGVLTVGNDDASGTLAIEENGELILDTEGERTILASKILVRGGKFSGLAAGVFYYKDDERGLISVSSGGTLIFGSDMTIGRTVTEPNNEDYFLLDVNRGTLDTNGHDVTVKIPIYAGSITKAGAGALIINYEDADLDNQDHNDDRSGNGVEGYWTIEEGTLRFAGERYFFGGMTIGSDENTSAPEDSVLHIPAGAVFTNEGVIINYDTIHIEGHFINNDRIYSDNKLKITGDGKFEGNPVLPLSAIIINRGGGGGCDAGTGLFALLSLAAASLFLKRRK